ncbi:MAG: InlB B-repeat-containing protein [Clostridia bacterium]|nr:InlB B-repeat-containing protein [Clostridia bacterium]
MKKLLAILVLAVILLSTVSCGGSKVTVNLGGGTIDSAYVENADFEDMIASIPTKEGYEFAGWYSDAAFTDYIDPARITKAQEKEGRAFAKWIQVEEQVYNVRKDEISITDDGADKQTLDKVRLSEHYNLTDLKRAGYRSFKLEISFECAEKDDGYQYIHLYKSQNRKSTDFSVSGFLGEYVFGEDQSDPEMIDTYKFEIDPGVVGNQWRKVVYETVIDIGSLKDDLYICGSASGNDSDTWYNRNLVVVVTPTK